MPMPNTVVDVRFKMFGLATTDTFTLDEYNALLQQYPQMDTLVSLWKQYQQTLQEYINSQKTLESLPKTSIVSLEEQINVLKQKLSDIDTVINEFATDTTTTGQKVHTYLSEYKQRLNDDLASLQTQLDDAVSQSTSLTNKVLYLQAQVNSLRSQLEELITTVGGTLPR